MKLETIMQVEKNKIELIKNNNEKLNNLGMINKTTYNHNRMMLNGIEAVQKLNKKINHTLARGWRLKCQIRIE